MHCAGILKDVHVVNTSMERDVSLSSWDIEILFKSFNKTLLSMEIVDYQWTLQYNDTGQTECSCILNVTYKVCVIG